MPESVYKVIELVGTSSESWEKAAAARGREGRGRAFETCESPKCSELDLQIDGGVVKAYRAKVKVSFEYED